MCEEESDHGLFSFRALYEAYLACRKRKRNTANALKFEADQIENLRELSETLADGSYRPSRSVCFVTSVPKLREIFGKVEMVGVAWSRYRELVARSKHRQY